MTNPLLSLIETGNQQAISEASYFQAEVTAIDSWTGRVYILRQDDEDGFADDEPYPVLAGISQPEVGDWVMMARWGRSAVCLGTLVREFAMTRFKMTNGVYLAWGDGDPNGQVAANIGSLYVRTDQVGDPGEQIWLKAEGTGVWGWVKVNRTNRNRVVRQIAVYASASTTTSFVVSGFQTGPTITAASTTNGDATSGMFLSHATSTVSGNIASVVAGANSGVRPEWSPYISFGIRTPQTLTDLRFWVGLWTSGLGPGNTDTPSTNCAGFRFSSSAGDSNFVAYSNDGSGLGAATDTGYPFTINTGIDLGMQLDGNEVIFYINGREMTRHTSVSDIPGATGLLDYGIYLTTLNTTAKNIRWGRISMESEP